jgi:tripartite ATP-independent transporter DctM subunit
MIGVILGFFFLLLTIGAPIAVGLGLAGAAGIVWCKDLPLMLLPQRMLVASDSFPMLAIPLFILAGELMSAGGITRRLVRFSNSLVGHIKGGVGMSSIIASMIFAGISGSAVADASATGSILVPAMVERRYDPGLAAVIEGCSSSLGPIIPPSVLMVLYGSITGVSIGGLFLAGVIPGILIGISQIIITYYLASKPENAGMLGEPWAGWKEIWNSFWSAIPAMIMPILIIGGILSGIFTPTEAGAVSVLYSLIVGFFVNRELKIEDLPKMLISSASATAMVMLIISTASLFGWLLARERVPMIIASFMTSITTNPVIFMFITMLFLLVIGMVIEVVAVATIFGPVLFILGQHYGFDPILFGLIILIVIQFGAVTPPVGVILNITCALAKCSIEDAMKYLPIYIFGMLVVVLLVLLVPQLALYLPRTFM